MFSRKKNKLGLVKNLPSISTAPSIIVSDLNISGDLVSEGSIEIGGKVKGNIKCNNVIIRKEAKVNGDIYADNLIVNGFVKGVLNADNVHITESGIFEGQVNYKNITTNPGANINGILNKVNQEKDKILREETDDVSINVDSFDKSSDESKEEDKNKSSVEYIPSISALMDKDELIEDSKQDNNLKDSEDKASNVKKVVRKKSKKKSTILGNEDEIFNFSPPTDRKKTRKKKN